MSVPNYLYNALLEYSLVLIDEVNKLDNVDEIKKKEKYKKAYNKYLNAVGKFYREPKKDD